MISTPRLPLQPQAAGKWTVYPAAKPAIEDGSMELGTHVFALALYLGASSCAWPWVRYLADLTHEHPSGSGYTPGGAPLVTRFTEAAGVYTFTCDPVEWIAGEIPLTATYGVIYDRSMPRDPLVCCCRLTAPDVDALPARQLIMTPNPRGLFSLRTRLA